MGVKVNYIGMVQERQEIDPVQPHVNMMIWCLRQQGSLFFTPRYQIHSISNSNFDYFYIFISTMWVFTLNISIWFSFGSSFDFSSEAAFSVYCV